MEKTNFENSVEEMINVAKQDVKDASDIEKRSKAMETYKIAANIWLDYQKMEYSHQENEEKIINEAEKITIEERKNDEELKFKREELALKMKGQNWERWLEFGLNITKLGICVGGMFLSIGFETGGSFTTKLGQGVWSTIAKKTADI